MKIGSWLVAMSFVIALQLGIIFAIYVDELIFLREVEEVLLARKYSSEKVTASKMVRDEEVTVEIIEEEIIEEDVVDDGITVEIIEEEIIEEDKEKQWWDIDFSKEKKDWVQVFNDVEEDVVDDGITVEIIEEDVVDDGITVEIIEEEILDDGISQNVFPVVCKNATIISGYGMRNDPKNGESTFHHGVDIVADIGSDVVATDKGKVVHASWKGNRGKTVIVEAEERLFYYTHLSRIVVEVGDIVEREEKVGEVGSTGRSTGPHLHYEIRVEGESIDPIDAGYIEAP